MIRGDRLDTTMNYRLRDAVLALLAPQAFDSKGFADSGHQITVSQFANRLASIREDYPDAAYFTLLNLLDSHDTERLLWTLTPGAETTAVKESADALAAGKVRVRLASLIQFTVAGMPTVYYGDEVGMTGDDDPDDRRTYPWADAGGSPDLSLYASYRRLAALRKANPALTRGDFRILVADDATSTVAYGRKTAQRAALVVLNVGDTRRTVSIPVAGYLPNGVRFAAFYKVGTSTTGSVAVVDGHVTVDVPPMGGLYLDSRLADLSPTRAPAGLTIDAEGNGSLDVSWDPVAGATGYDVFTSPVTGGGYVKANGAPVTGTSFSITGLTNARTAYVVVRALDRAGNASAPSNEASGIPHPAIGWANLQWPPTLATAISAVTRTDNVYGQVWIDGVTNAAGAAPGLRAQAGFGPAGSDPSGAGWTWVEAAFNTQAGNNDEFVALVPPRNRRNLRLRLSILGDRRA